MFISPFIMITSHDTQHVFVVFLYIGSAYFSYVNDIFYSLVLIVSIVDDLSTTFYTSHH